MPRLLLLNATHPVMYEVLFRVYIVVQNVDYPAATSRCTD
jgi:hypothetical protein